MTVPTVAKVELYNHDVVAPDGRALYTRHGYPRFVNGWLVARYMADGRRMNTLRKFGEDEQAARAYAAAMNEGTR